MCLGLLSTQVIIEKRIIVFIIQAVTKLILRKVNFHLLCYLAFQHSQFWCSPALI